MSDIMTLRELLSATSDIAIVLFAYFLWRLDRRLFAVELWMQARISRLEKDLGEDK